MHDLSVLESIHAGNPGPAVEKSFQSSATSSTQQIVTTGSSNRTNTSKLELASTEVLPLADDFRSETNERAVVGVAIEEEHTHTNGGINKNSTMPSVIESAAKRPRELSQWPSESAILVAVRVRPFSPSEKTHLPQAPSNKFNFSAEASLSGGFGSAHSRTGDSYDTSSTMGSGSRSAPGGGLRRVVDVLDESVLVFDAPDAESISKYKRALLPVQAYRRFKDMRYAFDRVFHEDSQQQEVFENTTRHLIDGVLGGYNGTLFAYGATGCGKTHTISGTPEKPGIIFLTMQELYERIRELEDEKTIEISLSYLEVYNETIRDLLAKPYSDTAKPPSLHLREDSSRRVTIAGLSEHHPKGMDALMELVFMGNENRTMCPTEANATSSRSHAVLQINICQRLKTANVSEDFTIATLSLIDLAGSERASATKNRGSRLIEGANINKSLLALGNCINALCENKPKSHIPYRDSKLTRLLKFSLGGNCKTVMIACVSPSSQHYEETHNTLKYANRAKNIKTKVTKNTLNVDRHVSEYVQAIYELRQEVAELKGKLHNQAKNEGFERAQQRQELLGRDFEDMVRKMRATFQTARSQESTYAQLQSQLFIASARLSGLYRWRAGFDEASQAARRQNEKLDQERELREGLGETTDDAEAASRVKKLQSSLSASSSYIKMVDQLIDDLNAQTVQLTRQMQEHEDALKLYAVSIQSMERKDNPIFNAGFPFQRLYELEKKCQALESHNKILTTKLELSDKSLSEQFSATEDFMELSARSLVGLRPEIETIEQAGLATKTLNDIYMASITSFTDMTKRVGSFLPHDQGLKNPGLNSSVNDSWQKPAPGSPFKRNGTANSVGLNGSRMMSILPEVPQTPVKRQTTSHVLPNLSMDTVDTKLALGSSSLFGNQSPIRMYQERTQMQHPPQQQQQQQMGSPQNPFQVAPLPLLNKNHGNTTPRRKSSPMAAVMFSPKRRRARGGLRQPRLASTPTKRSVNFVLDIVAEDEERYTTGMRDPSLPLLRPTPFPFMSSSSPTSERLNLLSTGTTAPPIRFGMGGGAKRLVPVNSTNGATGSGQGSARRMVVSSKTGKAEGSKGPSQRVTSSATGSGATPSSSSSSSMSASPTKRLWQTEKESAERNTKRARSATVTATLHANPIHGVSAATAARIARRQSMMPTENGDPCQPGSVLAPVDRDGDSVLSSPPSRQAGMAHQQAINSNGEFLASFQGSSRIPVPSPPSANGAKAPLRVAGGATNDRRKSMTRPQKTPSFGSNPLSSTASTTTSTATSGSSSATSRRRSLGPAIIPGTSLMNITGEERMELSRIRIGSGIGGGAIRDASVRRRERATASPPREIPSFRQATATTTHHSSESNHAESSTSTRSAADLAALRANRRRSMMAALPGTHHVRNEATDQHRAEGTKLTTIPVPVTGSSRRKSLGPGRVGPLLGALEGETKDQDHSKDVPTTLPVSGRRTSMFGGFGNSCSSSPLPGAAGGFGFGQVAAVTTTAAAVQSRPLGESVLSSDIRHQDTPAVVIDGKHGLSHMKDDQLQSVRQEQEQERGQERDQEQQTLFSEFSSAVQAPIAEPDVFAASAPSETTAALLARLRQKRNAALSSSGLDDPDDAPSTSLSLAQQQLKRRPIGFGVGFNAPPATIATPSASTTALDFMEKTSSLSFIDHGPGSPSSASSSSTTPTLSPAKSAEAVVKANASTLNPFLPKSSLRLANAATLLGSSMTPSSPASSLPSSSPPTSPSSTSGSPSLAPSKRLQGVLSSVASAPGHTNAAVAGVVAETTGSRLRPSGLEFAVDVMDAMAVVEGADATGSSPPPARSISRLSFMDSSADAIAAVSPHRSAASPISRSAFSSPLANGSSAGKTFSALDVPVAFSPKTEVDDQRHPQQADLTSDVLSRAGPGAGSGSAPASTALSSVSSPTTSLLSRLGSLWSGIKATESGRVEDEDYVGDVV